MIVRDGTPFSTVILFPTGQPNTVSWSVRDSTGVIGSGTITPAADAVSVPLTINSAMNTLAGVYFAPRDVEWTYTVGGVVTNGEVRYMIEARLPVGISADGVRAKLGVSSVDLPDLDISLIRAFLLFRDRVTGTAMDLAYDGALKDILIRDAVEAMAARIILPTMIVRVASSEESGTNKYKRQAIDWQALGLALDAYIGAGIEAVIDGFDASAGFGVLFILAPPAVDAFTGA